MRRRLGFFLIVVLLTAFAAGGAAAYRTSTVQAPSGKPELARSKSRAAYPAQLADSVPLLSPPQHLPRGFFPPADLPALPTVEAFVAPGPGRLMAEVRHLAAKRYLDHNYPYHAFW